MLLRQSARIGRKAEIRTAVKLREQFRALSVRDPPQQWILSGRPRLNSGLSAMVHPFGTSERDDNSGHGVITYCAAPGRARS